MHLPGYYTTLGITYYTRLLDARFCCRALCGLHAEALSFKQRCVLSSALCQPYNPCHVLLLFVPAALSFLEDLLAPSSR